jgi:hypothetical protein
MQTNPVLQTCSLGFRLLLGLELKKLFLLSF